MAIAKVAHGQPVDIQSETHGAVATLLKAAPFLQVADAQACQRLRSGAEPQRCSACADAASAARAYVEPLEYARMHCTRQTAGENL